VLSAGAVCFNLLVAAHAMGYAGVWITEWPAYDERARAVLGLKDGERIAGFIHLGTATRPAIERARVNFESRVTRL
jgi:nitroreductase